MLHDLGDLEDNWRDCLNDPSIPFVDVATAERQLQQISDQFTPLLAVGIPWPTLAHHALKLPDAAPDQPH